MRMIHSLLNNPETLIQLQTHSEEFYASWYSFYTTHPDCENFHLDTTHDPEIQAMLYNLINEKNIKILDQSTDKKRLDTMFHLRCLGIQSNLDWIANPCKNDEQDDI